MTTRDGVRLTRNGDDIVVLLTLGSEKPSLHR